MFSKTLTCASAALSALIGSSAFAETADLCWFYVHRTLDVPNEAACAAKAEAFLDEVSGGLAETRASSDDQLLSTSAPLGSHSAEVLCYEVNGDRGPVMAVIMVAGTQGRDAACEVARVVFEEMRE